MLGVALRAVVRNTSPPPITHNVITPDPHFFDSQGNLYDAGEGTSQEDPPEPYY